MKHYSPDFTCDHVPAKWFQISEDECSGSSLSCPESDSLSELSPHFSTPSYKYTNVSRIPSHNYSAYNIRTTMMHLPLYVPSYLYVLFKLWGGGQINAVLPLENSIFPNSRKIFFFSLIKFKLQMKWKLIHLTSVYSLTDSLICPHNALVSHLKLVPGFLACFSIWI